MEKEPGGRPKDEKNRRTMELDENYISQYKQIVKDSLDQLDNSAAMDGDVADGLMCSRKYSDLF